VRGFYGGKTVVITGGLGFIGSNLAIRLAGLGAKVTVVDSRVAGCGANPENLASIASQIRVIERDISEAAAFRSALSEAQVIFNLAGEVSHIHSMEFPARDLQINAQAQLQFLMECARAAPGVRIIYAGTRQVYGVPRYLPVDEAHPVEPIDVNGVHKHAAAQHHLMLTRLGRLDAIVLRLSNVYGPRMAVHAPCQGFLPVFFRRLLRNEPIEIYGDGRQLRDPVYVEDVVESFLSAGRIAKARSRTYNIGGPAALPIGQIAQIICEAAGVGAPVQRVFPQALRAIDIGGYASDCRLAGRELRWSPRTSLEQGVAATMAHLRDNWARYQQAAKTSECPLRADEAVQRAATA
jgi:UDP-glucose 4-epimerase